MPKKTGKTTGSKKAETKTAEIKTDAQKTHPPKVVCIGCGTGQAMVLRGLKKVDCDISAIVAVTDNGGHSGLLRKILNIPQVGDTRSCLAELADHDHPLKRLLNYRFASRELEGASLGNLMLAALAMSENSLSRAVNALRKMLNFHHRIFPVSDGNTHICAEVEQGKIIVGEYEIMNREPREEIKRLFLKDNIEAHPYALMEIETADLLVICPGSLRTGIVSILLTKGIAEAIKKSKARKIYVCNLMTHPGQTDNFSANDHIRELVEYMKTPPDYVLINTGEPDGELLRRYRKVGSVPVSATRSALPRSGIKFIKGDFVERLKPGEYEKYQRPPRFSVGEMHFIRHDPCRTAEAIMKLLKK